MTLEPTQRLALEHAAHLVGRAAGHGTLWAGDLELALSAIRHALDPADPRHRDAGLRAIRLEQARQARRAL